MAFSFFSPRICFPPWHNIFRDSTFPSLAEGGLLTKLDNREEIEQVREKPQNLEKPNAKREKKEETWEIIRRDKKQFSLSQCLKSWWGKTEKNYHESENGLFELVFKSGGSSLWWKMRFLNNLWWVLTKGRSPKKNGKKKGTLSPFGDPPLNGSKGDICCLITDKSA